MERPGEDGRSVAPQARRGWVGTGEVWHDPVRRGMAGEDWLGAVRLVEDGYSRRCRARTGAAMHGE
jgi:hypothetical protein